MLRDSLFHNQISHILEVAIIPILGQLNHRDLSLPQWWLLLNIKIIHDSPTKIMVGKEMETINNLNKEIIH